jgi:adenosylcobinamide-phosphate synthase
VLVNSSDLLAGVALDLAIGDPAWLPHPVRAIGWFAGVAERLWRSTGLPLQLAGALFWFSVVGLTCAIVWITVPFANIYWIYAFLACRDLDIEAGRVIRALRENDLPHAREMLSYIVGRDTENLDEPEILRATIETVAENLSDGVIAPLFWLAIAGPVGMAGYKAVNTLDSMVGHRNERYRDFGCFSARADDAANFVPARVAALLIWVAALIPGFNARRSFQVTMRDGATQPSPNSGYPEAAAAGALEVQLGGLNRYRGVVTLKPTLGDPIVRLTPAIFQRMRILLYVSEGLFVTSIVGCLKWR